jgi:hypothetical protein
MRATMNGAPAGFQPGVNASVEISRRFGTTSRKMPEFGKRSPFGPCITKLKRPPARGSITGSLMVQGFGANHCARMAGSV